MFKLWIFGEIFTWQSGKCMRVKKLPGISVRKDSVAPCHLGKVKLLPLHRSGEQKGHQSRPMFLCMITAGVLWSILEDVRKIETRKRVPESKGERTPLKYNGTLTLL